LDTGTKQFVASIGIGLGAGRTRGALCDELSARAVGPERGIEPVPGRTRLSAVPSDDDGGIASVCLQSRHLFVAADRASLPGAGGLHGINGKADAGFSEISLFRLQHLEALKGLFGQVLKLCRRAGLAKLGHVALDGTKMRANANRYKSMSYGGMKKREEELKAEIESWFEQARAIDREEDEMYGEDRSGDELPDWVQDKQKRLEKIQQAKAELEAEARAEAEAPPDPIKTGHKPKPTGIPAEKAQRNFTDSESRIMKSRDGFIQGYNAQMAVDADSQVIVAQRVSDSGNDVHQMIPLLNQVRALNKRQAKEISADAGYTSEHNLKELRRRRIRGYVASRWQKNNTPETGDPQPPAKVGRYVRQMWRRLRQGGHRSRYRLRKQVVEPVFGQIKQARGFRQFLLRGEKKVAGEWSLLCTAHNLLKLAAVTV